MKDRIFTIFVSIIFIPVITVSTPITVNYGIYDMKGQNVEFISDACEIDGHSVFSNDFEVLVRLYREKETIDLPHDIKIVGKGAEGWIDVIIPQSKLIELSTSDLNYSVIIRDVKNYDQQIAGHYHTLADCSIARETRRRDS